MSEDLRCSIDIAALPLNASVRTKLQCAGFRSTRDLDTKRPIDLAIGRHNTNTPCVFPDPNQHQLCHSPSESQLSPEEALTVLKIVPSNLAAQSAVSLYNKEFSKKNIITFSKDLDELLGGGIRTGTVTEFCGVPGVGKTQLGMQLAIDVQIPPSFNGVGGQAIYLDTEGSFTVERCAQMADAYCSHIHRLAQQKNDPARRAAASQFSIEKCLDNIQVIRARDATEQAAAVRKLASLLSRNTCIKLVIIDSVTFHYRSDYSTLSERTRTLAHMAQTLMALACEKNIAVVLMNQVTTKISGEDARLVPALGDSWAHAATTRVVLYWKDGKRHAYLYKSPTCPSGTAEYSITSEGVRTARTKQTSKRPRAQQ